MDVRDRWVSSQRPIAGLTSRVTAISTAELRPAHAAQDRLGEKLALNGVLIARVEIDAFGIRAAVHPDSRPAVGRRVKGDLDLDPAARAHDIDALMARQLSGAGER